MNNKSNDNFFFYLTISIFIISILLAVLIPYFIYIFPYQYERDFNSKKWINSPRYRQSMQVSLTEYLEKNRPDKRSVVSLLGQPDISKENRLYYFIKAEGIDVSYFEVFFLDDKYDGCK